MEKFKQFVKDNKFVIIESVVLATVSVATYTFVCGRFGYVMAKPNGYDEKVFCVRTPTGRFMHSALLPLQ